MWWKHNGIPFACTLLKMIKLGNFHTSLNFINYRLHIWV
ncbi:hypothetical protein KKPNMP14_57040 [Klebsiella pneumoniae subsp. pneumoniae MP14]|nr:hypothetical protein KKPNMP14_57040 [Klebsiella pneumoniae subsp. pneumoniae MP14]